jgi:inner membrane protein
MTDDTNIISGLIARSAAALKSGVERIRSSVLCRFAMIGAIVLAMLVPLSMVEDVVFERAARHKAVLAEIAGLWGGAQTLIGPVLVLPYREKVVAERQALDKLGRWKTTDDIAWLEHTAIALPQDLDLDIDLQTSRRNRGIYEALVYTADVAVAAVFAKPEIAKLVDEKTEIEID